MNNFFDEILQELKESKPMNPIKHSNKTITFINPTQLLLDIIPQLNPYVFVNTTNIIPEDNSLKVFSSENDIPEKYNDNFVLIGQKSVKNVILIDDIIYDSMLAFKLRVLSRRKDD
jgi:hypothetical protein